jgi:plastocyanin
VAQRTLRRDVIVASIGRDADGAMARRSGLIGAPARRRSGAGKRAIWHRAVGAMALHGRRAFRRSCGKRRWCMSRKKQQKKARRRWKTSRLLTWVGLSCIALAIIVLSFFAFTNGGGEDQPRRRLRQDPVVSQEQQVTVEAVDNDYEPRHLTVNLGTEITWRMDGDAAHTITDEEGSFDSGVLDPGDEYVLTFEKAGTYYYYCTLHHAMQGTLVVEPANAELPPG